MNDKAIEIVTREVVFEIQKRLESVLPKKYILIIKDTVRIMAEWYELDDTRPTSGPLSRCFELLPEPEIEEEDHP